MPKLHIIDNGKIIATINVHLANAACGRANQSTCYATDLLAIRHCRVAFLSARSYTYDDNGNITSVVQDGVTTAYTYDALGQLIRVVEGQENATWVYEYETSTQLAAAINRD